MNIKIISGLLICLLPYFSATAQSMRAPTPVEKTALMKVIDPLNENFSRFLDKNWEKTEGFDEPDMDVPNSPRSQLRTAYSVSFKLKEGSPLYNQLMQPVLRLLKENKNDSLQDAYAKWKNESEIHIDIIVNGGGVALGSAPGKIRKLTIPGAAQAFIVAEDNNTPRRNGAFVLAFGHWGNAKYDNDNHVYDFKYIHPPQTPFIESVVIEMYGNSERINEIIKQCDWTRVTASLAH